MLCAFEPAPGATVLMRGGDVAKGKGNGVSLKVRTVAKGKAFFPSLAGLRAL